MDSICDVDSLATVYNTILADLIDKHAPEQRNPLPHAGNIKDTQGKSEMTREKGDG